MTRTWYAWEDQDCMWIKNRNVRVTDTDQIWSMAHNYVTQWVSNDTGNMTMIYQNEPLSLMGENWPSIDKNQCGLWQMIMSPNDWESMHVIWTWWRRNLTKCLYVALLVSEVDHSIQKENSWMLTCKPLSIIICLMAIRQNISWIISWWYPNVTVELVW